MIHLEYNIREVIFMAISRDNDRVIVTIPREVKAKLNKLAQEDSRTLSNYLNVVITNYLNSIEEDDK